MAKSSKAKTPEAKSPVENTEKKDSAKGSEYTIKSTSSRGVSLCEKGAMIDVPAYGKSDVLLLDEDGVKSLTQNLKRFPQLSLVSTKEAEKEEN